MKRLVQLGSVASALLAIGAVVAFLPAIISHFTLDSEVAMLKESAICRWCVQDCRQDCSGCSVEECHKRCRQRGRCP